jgi:predicted RNA-binding Zn ribbon-like protein
MTTKSQGKTPPEPASRQRAPGELGLVQEFINAGDLQGEDRLAQPLSLEEWLRAHRLLALKGRVSEADVRHAIGVREALRDMLAANDGAKVNKDAVEMLSRAARSAQLAVQFDEHGRAKLEPGASGVDAAIGTVIGIAVRAMLDGSWRRLKACRDETCRWAFYDRSKNRSSRWCVMSVCGNRSKVRKFRALKRRPAAGPAAD